MAPLAPPARTAHTQPTAGSVEPEDRPPEESRHETLMLFKEMESPDNVKRLFEPFRKMARLMAHYPDEEIQEKGCMVMSINCYTHHRYVMKGGGLKAIFEAMMRWPLNARLQQHGLEALRVLSWTWDGARRVVEMGGLEVAMTAAANITTDEPVQQEVIGVLSTIAAKNAEKVLDVRGYELILRALENESGSWMLAWCVEAMKYFAETNHKVIDADYILQLIQTAKDNATVSPNVQQASDEASYVIREKFGMKHPWQIEEEERLAAEAAAAAEAAGAEAGEAGAAAAA